MKHHSNLQAGIAATLVVLAVSTVALSSDLFVTEALQKGQAFTAAGERLTGDIYVSEVAVAEPLSHPSALTGGRLVLNPGFIAKKKFMRETAPPSTGIDDVAGAPDLVTRLGDSYPNPFNPSTTVRFSLAGDDLASVKIFDVRGRLVRTLVDRELEAGAHEVRWDGRSNSGSRAASGVYFVRMTAGGFTDQHKIVMSR